VVFFYRLAPLVLSILATAASFAIQKDSVRIFGDVHDSSGAVVSGATLDIKPDCKCSDCSDSKECKCCPPQVTVTTDSSGHYEVRIPAGNYTFQVRNTKVKVAVGSEDKNVNITVQ